VFCCDIDKTGQFAVTGGEDDLAYVWDLRTGEVKLTCKDNSVRQLISLMKMYPKKNLWEF
jgi:WD40 repeat protein